MKSEAIGGSDMLDKLSVFMHLINNPATKRSLQGLTGYCNTCGKSRIEVALDLFVGEKKDACWKCKLAEKIIEPVLQKGADTFNVALEELKKKFKDTYWKKGLASVIKGLAYFGIRRPFVPGAPFQVVWDVTYACNLRCKHCYATAGRSLPDELTTEEALDAIDKFDRLGVAILSFSGGEPLIRKDIFELTRYAAEKGIYIGIATNGTLITEEIAKKMKENGVSYLQISLDGTRETHDNFRGIPGCYDRTIAGIKNAVKEGFFVNVSMTVTKLNLDEVSKVIELCEKLEVDWFMHYNFIPTGRGGNIVDLDLSPEEREELLKMLYESNKSSSNSKLNLLSTAPQFARVALQCEAGFIPTHFYNMSAGEKLKQLAEFIGGCGAGRFYMSMKSNGDIQPCVFFPLKVGNIHEDDLEDLWLHNNVFEELRNKDIIEGCRSCNYNYYCGGCRARAYNYFGDYLKPDPGCINNKRYWKKLVSNLVEVRLEA
jgi:radical SAM protein with 4Fe4S-binding SPASM domain